MAVRNWLPISGALAALLLARPLDWIVYNATPSVPRGFYVRLSAAPARGSFVTVRARDVALSYAAWRGFSQPRDRFIKRVAATGGDRVCASAADVTVGRLRVERLTRDRGGRRLPSWNGCRVLQADEFFLLGDTPDSFDSRYFGVVTRAMIEGVWRPL